MSDKITASDLNMALDAMKAKREKWINEHPGEKEIECPKCRNTGLVLRVYDEFGKEVFGEDAKAPGTYEYFEPCSCIKGGENVLLKNNKNYANVPPLFKDAMFSNFQTDIYDNLESRQLATIAKSKCMGFLKNIHKAEENGLGLYIFSDAKGSGKSRLAATISNELTARGIRNKFASASGILSDIQESWNDNSESKVLKMYTEPKILIVDDFGARGSKEWIDKKFQYLIETRYNDMAITIFTSNFEIANLPFNDDRIMNRILDVDRFYAIKMPNETVRPKPKKNPGKNIFTDIFEL